MLRIGVCLGILLVFLKYNLVFSQVIYEFPLPDTFNAVDLYLNDNQFLNLVERNALYQLNGSHLEKKQSFDKEVDKLCFENNIERLRIYSNLKYGFTEINHLDRVSCHTGPVNSASLAKTKENYTLHGKHIYSMYDSRWSTLLDDNTLTEFICSDKNNNLLFGTNGILFQYNIDIGLDTIQSDLDVSNLKLCKYDDDHFYFTSCQTFYKTKIIDDSLSVVDSLHLKFDNCVIDFIINGSHAIVISHNEISIVSLSDYNQTTVDILPEAMDEWVSLEANSEGSFWLLSRQKLYLITNQNIRSQQLVSKDQNNLHYYKIRNQAYLTDGESVYKENKLLSSWEADPTKIPPSFVSQKFNQHPYLIFPDEAIEIHTDNALILNSIQFPRHLICHDIVRFEDEIFITTNKGLFKNLQNRLQSLSEEPLEFHSFYVHNNQVFASTTKAIYSIQNSSLQKLDIQISTNSIFEFIDKHLIYLENEDLVVYSLEDQTESDRWLNKIPILDLYVEGSNLYILTPSSALIFPAKIPLNSNSELQEIIPFNNLDTTSRFIHIHNDTLLIQNGNELIKCVNEHQQLLNNTHVIIVKNLKENRLEIKHNNVLAKDVNYNYFLSSNKSNEMLWSSNNYISLDKIDQKNNSLVAAIKDDIFLQSHLSKVFELKSTNTKKYIPFYLISVLFIFAAIFSGLRMIKG